MRSASLVALLALFGCGDPLIFAEVEEQHLCVTKSGQQMQGFVTVGGIEGHISYVGSYDLGNSVPGLGSDAISGNVHALSLEIDAPTGVPLGGVSAASVTVVPYDGSVPDGGVLDGGVSGLPGGGTSGGTTSGGEAILALGSDGHPTPSSLLLTGDEKDIFQYITGGNVQYVVDATGSGTNLPQAPWEATISLCLYVRVRVEPTKLSN